MVVAAQFMFVVDAFIVNVAIPSIRADLHATPAEVEAVIAAYQITYATTVITGGRLGDIAGRRRVFVGGVLAFTAASLWCGLAGSGLELVLARMAQGVTAATMVPQVLATIHALFPGAGRPRAYAVFGIALGLSGAVGFALGEWLVSFITDCPISRATSVLPPPVWSLTTMSFLSAAETMHPGPQLGWHKGR